MALLFTLTGNFEIRLQYRVASLCYQLLPEFSSNQFETVHRCYKHIEDVHVTFCRRKIIFDKITAFLARLDEVQE